MASVPHRDSIVTAVINILDNENRPIQCRAILDSASSTNFITERLARKLNCDMTKLELTIEGMTHSHGTTNHLLTTTITSRLNNYSKVLQFLTVNEIGGVFPIEPIDRNKLGIPKYLPLADPYFDRPAPVDLLIGSGTTVAINCQGQIRLNDPKEPDLVLQETRCGWIVAGNVQVNRQRNIQSIAQCHVTSVEQQLKNFWEMDDVHTQKHWSKEEEDCADHYRRHVTRDNTGRYTVALPFNEKGPLLGKSKEQARRRFMALLKKFKRQPEMEEQYSAVINEYIELGHMSPVIENSSVEEGFYLPHHAVFKATSLTTKLRVVFDGSAKGEHGVSLNDTLMVGPTIQADIFTLLTRFLTHQYVLTGDIEKMYRQFWVRDEDRKYQKIFWKNDQGNEVVYQLNTVTFGLSAAPFLAIRCIHELADNEAHEFPEASNIIKRDLYVDDLLTGTDNFDDALRLRDSITALLKKGQLNIRQWASNDVRLLKDLPDGSINLKLKTSDDATIKTLGLHWNSSSDKIVYTVNPILPTAKTTKRVILSEVAKIFDPLGFLGPVIIKGRMILHKLWLEKLGWDDAIPLSILTEWRTYANQLTELNDLSFDRKVIIANAREIQLHGFCDASEKGYGACIYIRSIDNDDNIQVNLFCSKYRVAPVKPVTLPRLELCAALLLADLYVAVNQSLLHLVTKVVMWSDSMVALHWIKTPPYKLQVFVANRVSNIQQKTVGAEWRHVRSEDNPADHISRGVMPADFAHTSNWKNGPDWLSRDQNFWPMSNLIVPSEIPEMRKVQCLITSTEKSNNKKEKGVAEGGDDPIDSSFLHRFSSIGKLRRSIAICLRFRNKLQGPFSANELTTANDRIIKIVQTESFAPEIKELRSAKGLSPKHKWKSLHPFLDDNGLIRVGGRLKNAALPYDQKHPLLIPKRHHITDLLIRNEHLTNCHSGAQTTLYALRRKYWLIDGRTQVRGVIRNCAICNRADPPKSEYTMGNIPKVRLTEAKPFSNVGVDYCGPFFVKEKKNRNKGQVKIWVAIFVCLAIKAVHLEIVSDLTTECFMACLKRFVAQRGKPSHIYSDNGRTFIGAHREIKELYAFLQLKQHNEMIQQHLADHGITWHFTPPLSPHFGGLWEAGVKSFKHHLKRVTHDLMTFEQFNTLIIEIEAILNSRPLTPLSTDPNDLIALTPGHFLTGDSLMSLPETEFCQTPDNRLSVWEFIQKKQQEFWKRWNKEYLNEQNQRAKWTRGEHRIAEGSVVILREDNLPPRQWALGRVVEARPGNDGVIRVVRVKTATGEFVRNIRRISPLLID